MGTLQFLLVQHCSFRSCLARKRKEQCVPEG